MIVRPHAVSFRYRVVRLWGEPSEDHDVGFGGDVREFKTLARAEAYQRRLAEEGEIALLQVGVLQWMPPNEAEEFMRQTGEEFVLE